MLFLRQGATHKVVVGPFVDVGDGFTPETGVTLSGADEAEVILHDNGTVVDISGYTWAAITTADGYYHLTLQSGISGTVGHMTVVVHDDSVCLPVRQDFTVIEEAVYDSMYAASAVGPLLASADGSTLTAINLPNQTMDITGNITGNLSGSVGSVTGGATASALATLQTTADDILVDTAEIGAAGAGLTAINLPNQTMDITGNITGNLSGSVGSVMGAVGSVTTVSDKTGYRLSATGVDDVLDEAVEGSVTLRQSVRLANAALGGKASGLETTTAVYRDVGDSKDRITGTVDADGNRTAVTLDLT